MADHLAGIALVIVVTVLYGVGYRIWATITEPEDHKIIGKVYRMLGYILCIQGIKSKHTAKLKPQKAIEKLLKELPDKVMRVDIEDLHAKRRSGSEVWNIEMVKQHMSESYPDFDLIKIIK